MDGYHTIPLDEESQPLTTFINPNPNPEPTL